MKFSGKMKKNAWRFIDTGALSAAENMALDDILLELRQKNVIPNTVRFLQFKPPAVLVGYHQSVDSEVRREYCQKMGIDINRRITGGGAILFDTTQIGWEIISDKKSFNFEYPNAQIFERLSTPIIHMLKYLNIPAQFRPRNDIEVSGRKISGTGGVEYGDAFLFQGTLLVDFDVDTMLRALRVPIEKLKRHEIDSLKERITCIKWELDYCPDIMQLKTILKKSFEEVFNIELVDSSLTSEEVRLLEERKKNFLSKTWIDRIVLPVSEQPTIRIFRNTTAGKIKAFFTINLKQHIIHSLIITGDFFAYPQRALYDFECLFKDLPLNKESIFKKINAHFTKYPEFIPGAEISEFTKIFDELFEKLKIIKTGIDPQLSNHLYLANASYAEILKRRPTHLLLPYCAKSLNCGYRYKDECRECNGCSVGEAYRLAHEHKIEPITITSFEDLCQKLTILKEERIPAYIGCCCEQFYIKHQEIFESFSIPGLLVDINSQTCYDLGKASFAYFGKFENQTNLDILLLKKVIHAL